MAVAAALAACCLAAAACGSASSATGAAPSASSTQDPLAGLTATAIEGKVFDNFKAATSLKGDGTLTEQGEGVHSSVEWAGPVESARQSCAGTARLTSSDGTDTRGSYRFSVVSSGVYVSPDATYWSGTSGFGSGKSYSLVAGKYLQFLLNDSAIGELGVMVICDRITFLGSLNTLGTVTKGAVITLNGIRVVPIRDSIDGTSETTDYVTDTSNPEVVELSFLDGSISGKYTFSVGAPVTVVAPPPSQVIPAAKLGM